ncbi:hypothetical protein SAMN06265338_101158 [Rhodoblastus acidophilus]|uniref:Uncharacterized protein n=1 Tax=Rhodoblastus acidophilus TaxID=1074 RepID=A0A212PY76_RHOAC|nr:hypothetical protein [Rhodoblastus acidophilus]PPQ38745.1 hypothetical protein CKO16_09045 [Rhodoblastus acidophilus]RAI20787.1 hypothetical protein CH337_09160 [Rhodoblastus acidophilus]SNB51970.1 hypothetical protein SAMN06265338_101158 [Rhodoblastus acidophilus]
MNTPQIYRRNTPIANHRSAPHRFALGQAVRLKGGFAQRAPALGVCHITRTLPPLGESPQYRIRNDGESHERLASQNELEAVTGEGADLMERTFHHG